MKPSIWPEDLDHIWAKSPEKGVGGQAETLATHTWSVLSTLSDLAHLRPDLPETAQCPSLWHRLYWAAFLHDWGKAAREFQDRLRGGPPWRHRHEVLSLAFLDWLGEEIAGEDGAWIAAAVVSHHRDARDVDTLYPVPADLSEDDHLEVQLSQISPRDRQLLWNWLSTCANAWIDDLALGAFVCPIAFASESAYCAPVMQGAGSVYRWLRTYRRLVRDLDRPGRIAERTAAIVLRGHLLSADHTASAHVERPLPTATVEPECVLSASRLTRDGLYRHQEWAWNTPCQALLEAPTGSGKTEAALLWASAQNGDGVGRPRLFYALPYQASMNAMQARLARTFGEDRVGLQHGRALLALYRLLLERDDYGPASAAAAARHRRELGRLNYLAYRVFSPYQMLKAFYRLKGYEALLADYAHGLFIFDEIHAYETTRLAIILKSVEHLSRYYGARFLFMSATFPSLIRDVLRSLLGDCAEIRATPALYTQFQRHRIVMLDGDLLAPGNLDRIEADARRGKSVLVCCNLVRRAQDAYSALQERLQGVVPVELLHGGFHMRDRATKERLIRETVGSSACTKNPLVLVATQVVEVSLDIDLDTLYTDPAPLEALIQRFGRINRRRKQDTPAPVHVFRLPDDGQYIYRPPELIARTLAILDRENGNLVSEAQVGAWVDSIYQGEIADQWRAAFSQAASDFEIGCLRRLVPFAGAEPDVVESFYRAFDGIDVIPKCLEDEYQELLESDPILAAELVLSIPYGRLMQLRRAHLTWEPSEAPIPIEVPYDSERGLNWDVLHPVSTEEFD